MNPRFTIDGSNALERHLAATCERVRDCVQRLVPASKLEGLLLGGGYGRGEGGVLRSERGDRPYNDLEFYVLIGGCSFLNERRYGHALHELGEQLSPDAGLEVEFKVLSLGKLRSSPVNMFYYDLVMGHRWFGGDDALLAGCEHHSDAARIPAHEATRLMMNRCSGLLYALERLRRAEFTGDDADFVGRNLAKAQLGFGDALLAASGQYHWSCRERNQRLRALDAPDIADIRRHHDAGVKFKLHPVRSVATREELVAQHRELSALGRRLWLWLENRRLGTSFATTRDYARSAINKCPETSPLRNRLVNLKTSGPRGLRCTRYPRERLLQTLPLLLWEESDRRFAARVAEYEQLWRRFN